MAFSTRLPLQNLLKSPAARPQLFAQAPRLASRPVSTTAFQSKAEVGLIHSPPLFVFDLLHYHHTNGMISYRSSVRWISSSVRFSSLPWLNLSAYIMPLIL